MLRKKKLIVSQGGPSAPSRLASYRGQKDKLPFICLAAILLCVLFADLALTTQSFWLYTSLLAHFHIVPHSTATQALGIMPLNTLLYVKQAWFFTDIFIALSLLYLYAIYALPTRISHRFILVSTTLIGAGYCLVPIVTSQDILSYIAYARMVVFYHLDPLVNSPWSIRHDYIYHFVYWVNQPSVYGPLWTALISMLQLLALSLGFKYALSMELFLRVFSLLLFLGSVQLVWMLSGRLQRIQYGLLDEEMAERVQTRRLRATLAFAWNPYLLLEICVNAHNDVVILFLVLLALWLLLPAPSSEVRPFVWSAVCLGLAACIKISYIILIPGLLLYVLYCEADLPWRQRLYNVALAALAAFGTIVVVHMPFWHHGDLVNVLRITPTASRNINSIYEFGVNILNYFGLASLRHTADRGAPIEVFSHWFSGLLFVVLYVWVCIRCLLEPRLIRTPIALVGWFALIWLCYCFIGSPWFWPWYTLIAFGLLALIEACQVGNPAIPFTLGGFDMGLVGRAVSLGMLGLDILWIFYNLFPSYRLHFLSSQLALFVPLLFLVCAYYLWRSQKEPASLPGDESGLQETTIS